MIKLPYIVICFGFRIYNTAIWADEDQGGMLKQN